MRRKTIEASFFYGAPSEIFMLAKELRKNSTKAEQELWKYLKNKQINGFYFRRQHPIHRFIADFFCYKAKLVIELDGRVHEEITVKESDNKESYKPYSESEKYEYLKMKNPNFDSFCKILNLRTIY